MWAGPGSGGFQVAALAQAKAVLDILGIQKVRRSGDAAQ